MELYYEERGKGPALYILTGGPGAPPEDPSYRIIPQAFYKALMNYLVPNKLPVSPQPIH